MNCIFGHVFSIIPAQRSRDELILGLGGLRFLVFLLFRFGGGLLVAVVHVDGTELELGGVDVVDIVLACVLHRVLLDHLLVFLLDVFALLTADDHAGAIV